MGRGYIKKEEKGLYEGLVARLEMGGERRERGQYHLSCWSHA